MSIRYQLQLSHPEAHLFQVSVEIDNPAPEGQVLRLPNWIPGSYMVRDFSRNIVSIKALSDGQPVALGKVDKSTWLAPASLAQLTVIYEVYAWDLSVRMAHLDTTHAFFNGTSVFLSVDGQEQQACELELQLPVGEQYADWQIATSMDCTQELNKGVARYQAADYDELIDHPVEMGTFTRLTFIACDVEHEVVLTGPINADHNQITEDLKLICEQQIRFFGEPAPMKRYVFLVMVVGQGYGGLEHRASTALLVTREHLPVPGATERSDEYLDFLGLCSHEYFHTWNVKRIKPARFVPYELAAESYTELLWAFEGITSYYDDLFLLRCGILSSEQYLKAVGKTITRVYRGRGRLKQSVADSSFDAWTKFYKQDENAPNAIVSYYAKGALVALCLDMLIRETSGHTRSLDDLMQALWQRWTETGEGVEQADFEQLAAQFAGQKLDSFFKQAVFGTEDLDLDAAFAQIGVTVNWRTAASDKDAGGRAETGSLPAAAIGAKYSPAEGGKKITHVLDNGAAQSAGLAAGDTLLALDGLSVSNTEVEKILARHTVGSIVDAHVFRLGVLMQFKLEVMAAPVDTCWLESQSQIKSQKKSQENFKQNSGANTRFEQWSAPSNWQA